MGFSSVSVVAANGFIPDEFIKLFGLNSDEKIQTANSIGSSLNISDESNGYTLTAEGFLEDSNNISILFKIEKTDGSSLADSNIPCTDLGFDKDITSQQWESTSSHLIEDEYNDQCIKFLHTYHFKDAIKSDLEITLGDFALYFGEKCEKIETKWTLNIPFDAKDCSVDLATKQKISIGDKTGTLDELRISPIGYTIKITSSDDIHDNELIKNIDGNTLLYLKNGQTIDLIGGGGPSYNDDGTWTFTLFRTFDKLIPLEDMEKIVIADQEISF